MNINIFISITSGILSYLLLSTIKYNDITNDIIKNNHDSIDDKIKSTQNELNNIIKIENKINKINNNNILSKFHNSFPLFKKNNLLWYRININSHKWYKMIIKNVFVKNNNVYVQLIVDDNNDGISDNDSTLELSGKSIFDGKYDNLYFQRYIGESTPNFNQNGGSKIYKINYSL
jgi:hypothetical protein